jgi:hypothetical protein
MTDKSELPYSGLVRNPTQTGNITSTTAFSALTYKVNSRESTDRMSRIQAVSVLNFVYGSDCIYSSRSPALMQRRLSFFLPRHILIFTAPHVVQIAVSFSSSILDKA